MFSADGLSLEAVLDAMAPREPRFLYASRLVLPTDEFMFLLAYRQHWTGRVADDPLRRAAQDRVSQPRVTVRGDDNQIDFECTSRIGDFAKRSASSHELLMNKPPLKSASFA